MLELPTWNESLDHGRQPRIPQGGKHVEQIFAQHGGFGALGDASHPIIPANNTVFGVEHNNPDIKSVYNWFQFELGHVIPHCQPVAFLCRR